MKFKIIFFISLAMILSACSATDNSANTNYKKKNMTQKRWINQETKRKGHGLIYPDYQAPKVQPKPSWAR